MDAVILLTFLVALAIAAPIWGYDSRDGFASLEHARRQAWWAPGAGPSARTGTSVTQLAPSEWSRPARPAIDAPITEPAAACVGALALAAE